MNASASRRARPSGSANTDARSATERTGTTTAVNSPHPTVAQGAVRAAATARSTPFGTLQISASPNSTVEIDTASHETNRSATPRRPLRLKPTWGRTAPPTWAPDAARTSPAASTSPPTCAESASVTLPPSETTVPATCPVTTIGPSSTTQSLGATPAPTARPCATDAQAKGWPAVASGEHTVIRAPTGSGKTLAAFLCAIDRLSSEPPPAKEGRTRVVYVSPLRALAVDVEKNLRAPLAGMQLAAERMDTQLPHVPTVGIRTGDTAARDRQRMIRTPPDVLITTPESLYLMLTSSARET